MRIAFSPGARADLDRIRAWIAQDNPERALSFVRELRDRTAVLAQYPALHTVVADSSLGPVRKLTHGNYLLFYRVLPDRIEVIAVRHGAQQAPRFD